MMKRKAVKKFVEPETEKGWAIFPFPIKYSLHLVNSYRPSIGWRIHSSVRVIRERDYQRLLKLAKAVSVNG
jgi:hypothetical protein